MQPRRAPPSEQRGPMFISNDGARTLVLLAVGITFKMLVILILHILACPYPSGSHLYILVCPSTSLKPHLFL